MGPKGLACRVALAVSVVAGVTGVANATTTPLSPTGLWDIQDNVMSAGAFFANDYLATANETVRFTDLYVVGDSFGVYLNGAFVGNSPSVPNYTAYGTGAFGSPFTVNANAAFASSQFSHGSLPVHAGDRIAFTNLSLPPHFPDGTIAVSAIAPSRDVGIPEPDAWSLMLLGFFGLGLVRRTRGRSPAAA